MAINPAVSGYGADLLALLRDRRSTDAILNAGSAYNPGQGSVAQSASSENPATIVTLSDRAKAIMTKAQQDQKVADRLGEIVSAGKGKATAKPTQINKAGADILAKYGDLPSAKQWASNASADNVGLLEAGTNGFDLQRIEGYVRTMQAGGEVFLGPDTLTEDERFVQSIQLRLAGEVVDLEKAGLSDKAQALRNAINSGTVRVQRADEVPDLNLNYTITHYADGGGGGTSSTWEWNPVGDAKTALDSRQAIAIGGVDRGAFFLSW
jgi:hypothetical protein